MNLRELTSISSDNYRLDLSEDKFLQLLKAKAKNSHFIAKQVPFFLKDDGADLQLITPAHKPENKAFWIDELISEMPSWRRYPSRKKFIKAYTSFDQTFGGNDVYVLIPFDGTHVGISPGPSFYRSFLDLKKNLNLNKVDNQSLVDWLSIIKTGLNKLTDIKGEFNEPTTYKQFKKELLKIDEILTHDFHEIKKRFKTYEDLDQDQVQILSDLLGRYIVNLERYLVEKLDPETNGFQSVRVESISTKPGEHEVWISDPCLLIKRSKYQELHSKNLIK